MVIRYIILLLFIVSIVQASSDSPSDEWTMYGRFLNHTRYTNAIAPTDLDTAPVENASIGGQISSSPAVYNGYVYTANNLNKVYQINASNLSQTIATYTAGNIFVQAGPAIADGYLYIGAYDGVMYKLNANNISQYLANYTTGGIIRGSATVANGYVYFGSTDNKVYQVNATDMSLVASYTTGNDVISSPAVADGYVYVTSMDFKMYQFNASNISQVIASYSTSNYFQDTSPTVAYGSVYVGSDDNKLYQFNASNVSRLIATYATGGDIRSSPAAAHGYVYVGSHDGYLYQFNATNISNQKANYSIGGQVWSSPSVTDNYVFVGSSNGQFAQFNAMDVSQKIGNYSVTYENYVSPAIAKGQVYTANNVGRLYRFGTLTLLNETDVTPPTITINYPANTTYNNQTINFSITLNEAGNATITINGTNYTMTYDGTTHNYTTNLSDGTHTITIYANDTTGNQNTQTRTFTIYTQDEDNDGVLDNADTLFGTLSSVTTSGFTTPNVTISGNTTLQSFTGIHDVQIYDGETMTLNFTHNFTAATLNLSKITITKTETTMLINLSGQILPGFTKTIYLENNNFNSLCIKDAEVATIDEITNTCDGIDEIDFTTCLGNNTGVTINDRTCIDNGTIITLTGLNHTGIKAGTPSTITSTNSGGYGFSYKRQDCLDEKDNDGDGLIDKEDPGCIQNNYRSEEDPIYKVPYTEYAANIPIKQELKQTQEKTKEYQRIPIKNTTTTNSEKETNYWYLLLLLALPAIFVIKIPRKQKPMDWKPRSFITKIKLQWELDKIQKRRNNP